MCLALAALATLAAATPAKPAAKRKALRPVARPTAKPGDLASLVTAWRESPTPAHRAAVESYAALHAKDDSGVLARLALGVGAYEQKDYTAAISALTKVQSKVPRLADYTGYYIALSRVESKDPGGVNKELAATHSTEIRSPLAGKAWVVQARAMAVKEPAEAVRLLREHYADLPQPEGDIT
ncbi:MAG TPA: hypothetical protein VGH38_13305, partial [Bryobacteraceae bacterium]